MLKLKKWKNNYRKERLLLLIWNNRLQLTQKNRK